MTDQPFGIADIAGEQRLRIAAEHSSYRNHWYWCRRHERAESAGERPNVCGYNDCEFPGHEHCIRVGPFMTEREANRLSDDGTGAVGYTHDNPLGMEVEQ